MCSLSSAADTDTSSRDDNLNILLKKPEFLGRLKEYNDFMKQTGLRGQLQQREVDGQTVLEGQLRVHWGVRSPIKLKDKDDKPVTYTRTPHTPKSWRRSYSMAIRNGLDDEFSKKLELSSSPSRRRFSSIEDRRRASLEDLTELSDDVIASPSSPKTSNLHRYHTISYKDETLKKSSINGHVFNIDTSVFTPMHGSLTTVRASSLNSTPQVINMLLQKFKVENDPGEYCLCTIKKTGEVHILKEDELPLIQRVLMGPLDEEAQIFIQEKQSVQTVSTEVAQFMNLPIMMLQGFLHKYQMEEEREMHRLKEKYTKQKDILLHTMQELPTEGTPTEPVLSTKEEFPTEETPKEQEFPTEEELQTKEELPTEALDIEDTRM